jgi:hypothetical protein
MQKLYYVFLLLCVCEYAQAQRLPCSNPIYRKFDFWVGEWEAFGINGSKAGDSKISVILDSCVILEEWTSAGTQQGLRYAGKSYNTYNNNTKQWQQTWVDNAGASTEYLEGTYGDGKIIFKSRPFKFKKDSFAIRRLTFSKINNDKLRQHGEISKDEGKSFVTEYDLEYRRKEHNATAIADTLLSQMMAAYNIGMFDKIADYYSSNAKIVGHNTTVSGSQNILTYWKKFSRYGGKWALTNKKAELTNEHTIWQKGTSLIIDKNNKQHKVNFTLVIIKENNQWKILQDAYW